MCWFIVKLQYGYRFLKSCVYPYLNEFGELNDTSQVLLFFKTIQKILKASLYK